MTDAFDAADQFLLMQARLLERRLFATSFLGAPATGVVDALRGYQNDDGGFGHGLEPDKRCPASLPIDVEVAFGALATAGPVVSAGGAAGTGGTGGPGAAAMVLRACDFLARTAAESGANGAVPLAFPVIESYPRASHWMEWTFVPGLNPTAGLVGLLCKLGIEHPWMTQATSYCWDRLESGDKIDEIHTLSEVLVFLEHVPDSERADKCATEIASYLPEIPGMLLDPAAPGYGMSPLQLAPTADARWRHLFDAATISAHLDKLIADQQPDGGWTVSWEPPSESSALEWRGIVTLQALRTLTSYGRLTAPA